MFKILTSPHSAVFALLMGAALAASAQDKWSGADKPKHVVASALSALVVEGVFSHRLEPVERLGVAMLPGLAKEIYDMRRGGSGFSGKDLGADLLGALAGMAFHGVVIRQGYVGVDIKF